MRPLDPLSSIKVKLGVVVVGTVAVTVVAIFAGLWAGLLPRYTIPIAVLLGLAMVQFLAHGMTFPLREMAAAAQGMARGDYSKRVTATARDEVGALARAFNAMASDLAEVDRMRRDLVANVSHELRTPISALRAALENMVDGVEEPDRDTLRTLLAQVERLGRLVHQLLDLSRLESGAFPLQRRSFAVGDVLDDVARLTRLHAPDVDVVVHVDRPAAHIQGDPERIHQVVANLVENAVRHSPPGGRVELRAFAADGSVTLQVSDDGPGIAPEHAERVFERFYRADAARSSDAGGAGLGLAIARGIVDLHGGDIRVEHRRPRGCRMVVNLPSNGAK
ncbi:MAG: ATP-binding protein [Actinomycetota bacterium]|nr:ATP-binding protein [Actinomycetota bacterium]